MGCICLASPKQDMILHVDKFSRRSELCSLLELVEVALSVGRLFTLGRL